MRIISFLFLIITASGLHSCGYSEEFNEINHDNKFIVSFPDYMDSCDDFQADLGYKNAYRNTYAFVKVYDKDGKSLEEFQHEVVDILKNYELLSDPLVTDSAYREDDNFKAIDLKLYGVMDEENIYYWHSTFETDEKFYEVVCWTRSMDRKQRYGPDLEQVIDDFKPLL